MESRIDFEKLYGKVWDTKELQKDFTVMGFQAPFVVVRAKESGKKGSLQFTHKPRYYYNFQEV